MLNNYLLQILHKTFWQVDQSRLNGEFVSW